jgi:succinyl-diaminopimelate desuccinylase
MQRIEEILRRHRLDFDITWTAGAQPFLTEPGRLSEAVAAAIELTAGRRPQMSTTGGTSDGRFIATVCPQVVEFGPLNATIHKVNECIPIADLEPLKDIYRRTLEFLLTEHRP